MARIEIIPGDITEADVEAIVNAANNELPCGGKVVGWIQGNGEYNGSRLAGRKIE